MTAESDGQRTELNPSQETETQCRALLKQWQRHELSYRETVEKVAGLVAGAARTADKAYAEQQLGYIQYIRGNLNTSMYHYDNAREGFASIGNWRRVALTDLSLGEALAYKGDYNRARFLFRKAFESAGQRGEIDLRTMALTSEGLMLLHMGRADVALPGLEDALHLLAEWNHKHPELSRVGADLHRGLAEAKLAAGDPAGAWTYARQALTYALESNLALCIGKANCALGDVITALPAIPETDREQFEADPDAYYSAALAALHAINADAEIAHTLFAQGMSLAARDHKLRAAHALQQAMISYTRLEMSADAARAAQAQLDITM